MASAPGKLMVLGEHAVVYGYPCLVTAISERIGVSATQDGSAENAIVAPGVANTSFIEQAIAEAHHCWGVPASGWKITVDHAFPNTYGFGSSSAVTVATLRALGEDLHIPQRVLFEAAYRVVLAVQGIGSGFDVAAAVYGGTLYYGGKGETIDVCSADFSSVAMVVGYTGIKADTTTLIADVARKKALYPEKVERIFAGIAALVDEAKQRLVEHDWERIGKLMTYNHEYLRDVGVSSPKLEALISAALAQGAWGAKLSGAGGGDCMIAVMAPETREAVEQAIVMAGGTVLPVGVNAEGVI